MSATTEQVRRPPACSWCGQPTQHEEARECDECRELTHRLGGFLRGCNQAGREMVRAALAKAAAKANEVHFTIALSEAQADRLAELGKSHALGGKGTTRDVIMHLVHSAADGVRRPGSWERDWLTPAFGDEW